MRSNVADYDTVWTTVVDHVEVLASHAHERPVSYAASEENLYEEVQSVSAANPMYDEIGDGYIWVAGEDPELGSNGKRRSGVFASGGDLGPDPIRANMNSLRTVDLVRAREAAKVTEPGLSQTYGEASWAPVAEARAKWKKSQISRDEYDHVVRAHTAVATDGQDAASPFLPIGLTDVMVRDMTPKALVARMELEKWSAEEVDEGKAFRLRLRAHRKRSSYKDRLYENLTRVEPRRDEDFVLPSERVDGDNVEGTGSLSVADIVADSNRTSTFTDMVAVQQMARQAAENEARRQVAIRMAEKEYAEASEELKAANLATGHGTAKEKQKKKAKHAMHVATNRLDELGMSKKAQAALSTKAMARPEVAVVEEEFELFVRNPKFKKKPKAKDGRTESTYGFTE